jgi:lipoprotein-anchoring transpeptidase ErfK/SrfK
VPGRFTAAAAACLAAAALLTLTACGGGASHGGSSADGAAPSPSHSAAAAPPRIRLAVADGQANASVRQAGQVTVTGGTLTSVRLTPASGGAAVAGTRAADGRSWQPAAALAPGAGYRITATAAGSGGRTATATAAFTTLAAAHRLVGTFTPDDGATVGVGMPFSLVFDKPVTRRAAVRAAVQVTSSSGQQAVGHWFGDRRLDFRPATYWTAGSTVTVRLHLDGVQGAAGAYGVQDRTVRFTVGRSQVSTVDVTTDTMRVVRDGRLIRTVPVTSGAPGRTTYNGTMVISQKLVSTEMDGATVGFAGQYDIPDVPHAMRLSDSGTFIHGNYWAPDSVFGHQDVSHGCVGLNDVQGGGDPGQDGAWFFRNSMVGDVVVVRHSHDHTIAPDNGFGDWNMSWPQWTAAESS